MAILQSWSQGEDVWGPRGMKTLWSAATVRIYGGGASEGELLRELAALVGHYRPRQASASSGGHGRSVDLSRAMSKSWTPRTWDLCGAAGLFVVSGRAADADRAEPGFGDGRTR